MSTRKIKCTESGCILQKRPVMDNNSTNTTFGSSYLGSEYSVPVSKLKFRKTVKPQSKRKSRKKSPKKSTLPKRQQRLLKKSKPKKSIDPLKTVQKQNVSVFQPKSVLQTKGGNNGAPIPRFCGAYCSQEFVV